MKNIKYKDEINERIKNDCIEVLKLIGALGLDKTFLLSQDGFNSSLLSINDITSLDIHSLSSLTHSNLLLNTVLHSNNKEWLSYISPEFLLFLIASNLLLSLKSFDLKSFTNLEVRSYIKSFPYSLIEDLLHNGGTESEIEFLEDLSEVLNTNTNIQINLSYHRYLTHPSFTLNKGSFFKKEIVKCSNSYKSSTSKYNIPECKVLLLDQELNLSKEDKEIFKERIGDNSLVIFSSFNSYYIHKTFKDIGLNPDQLFIFYIAKDDLETWLDIEALTGSIKYSYKTQDILTVYGYSKSIKITEEGVFISQDTTGNNNIQMRKRVNFLKGIKEYDRVNNLTSNICKVEIPKGLSFSTLYSKINILKQYYSFKSKGNVLYLDTNTSSDFQKDIILKLNYLKFVPTIDIFYTLTPETELHNICNLVNSYIKYFLSIERGI